MAQPFDHLPRPDIHDPAGAVEALQRRADTTAALTRELDELVGQAESEDGLISTVVGAEGLRSIDLQPRAMRLPSTDIAETIVLLTRRATEDLLDKRRVLLAAAGIDTPRPDLDESRAKLAELELLVRSGTGDMSAVYERFRHRLGL